MARPARRQVPWFRVRPSVALVLKEVPMPVQQVCSRPARSAIVLVLTVHGDRAATAAVRSLLGDLPGLTRSVSFRVPEGELISVIGIGAGMWDRLFEDSRPRHLHPFAELHGATHSAPSTPGDLLLHLRAAHVDLCFELARLVMERLREHVEVVDEVHGFRYFDERDLLGFVDGTENPEGDSAVEAVTVGDEDPDHAGGSYVIVQKYLHDMEAWNALSVEQQEAAIGRSKLDDVEMADDVKPANSHVALNDISDADGNDLDIVRENMPFGAMAENEFGTYFIGYAKDPGITERMLRNMFIGIPEGNHDRLLDFSRAVTGGLFFVPSEDFLDSL